MLRTLEAAVRDGDARATARAAHWLAGSVLSILVQGLAELARGLETDLLDQACTTADERCARLARGTRAVLDLLARRYA
jgi:HPt (histidine-containing phosphotransfer) domain-containing protein